MMARECNAHNNNLYNLPEDVLTPASTKEGEEEKTAEILSAFKREFCFFFERQYFSGLLDQPSVQPENFSRLDSFMRTFWSLKGVFCVQDPGWYRVLYDQNVSMKKSGREKLSGCPTLPKPKERRKKGHTYTFQKEQTTREGKKMRKKTKG